MYPLVLVIGTADSECSVPFSHCITLLSLCDFCEGARGSPRPASVRRTAECDAGISYRRLYCSISGSFSPYANAAHTRSTLRNNRFCGYGWDNYPIWTTASNLGVFVRDSNSAVTVKLPTRKPTDTPRR